MQRQSVMPTGTLRVLLAALTVSYALGISSLNFGIATGIVSTMQPNKYVFFSIDINGAEAVRIALRPASNADADLACGFTAPHTGWTSEVPSSLVTSSYSTGSTDQVAFVSMNSSISTSMPTWRFDSSDPSQGTIYCSVNGYSAQNGASELAFTIEAAPLVTASALPSLPPAPSMRPSVSTSWSPSATVSTSYTRSASVTLSRLPSRTLSPTRSSSASLNVRSVVANGAVLSGTVTQGRYLFFVLASANATGACSSADLR